MDDPIVQKVRKAREKIAKKFNYNLHAIFLDVRTRQKELGERLISPGRIPKQKCISEKASN